MEDDYNIEDIIRDDVHQEIREQLFKCIKKYGLEGCEEKLNELLSAMPKVKELFFKEYYRILKG